MNQRDQDSLSKCIERDDEREIQKLRDEVKRQRKTIFDLRKALCLWEEGRIAGRAKTVQK